MEKKKPTIDEIYKINVDGLFESTANWFDNAFKKSQAEINRDLYNKINGYSSSSESTGGNVNLGPLLTSLNGSNLYPSRGYLYYNGNDWEFNTPTISGGGGGVVDTAAITKIVNDTIKNVSWWGQTINNNKVDGNIVITKGSHSFTIELDDNGNLKFNGNIYATGGVTALGVGTTTGGGSGVSLGTLLTKLNSDNPFPTGNGQVLTYDGSNFIWKTPTGSGGTSGGGIRIKRNGNTLKDSNGNVLSCTSINFKYGQNWNSTPILINSDNEISVDLSVVANNGNGSSSSSNYPLTIYNGSSDNDYITYDGSSSAYLRFKSGFSISKTGLGYEISASGGGSGVTLSNVMSAMNDQLGKTSYGIPQFLYWDGSTYTWKNESEISGGSGSTSTSVSWSDVTNKPSTFTPSSHTHLTNDINGLSNYVQGVKVSNATNADKATQLANSRTIWGQSFNGTSNINGNLYMGSEGGGSIQLWMNNGNMLDRTDNTLHIGYGLKESSDGEINLDAYATKVYTDNMSKHYDFKSNVFDVNSNQIHFGSETNGGKIYWDAANNSFKIEGNVYATGGITALGVSNNATTSNNVDFTFRSVTINCTRQNKVQLTDEGLVFYNQDIINAYYKKDSIGLYDSANDVCCKIFGFNDSELVFDPDRYSVNIIFNSGLSCYTDENTLNVGTNTNTGYIYFYPGSTMTFKYNNKEYNFNVAKAIEQGILTV